MKLSEWLNLPNPDGSPKNKGKFAEDIGVTPQMISAYCSGKSWPNRKRMVAIHDKTDGAVAPNDWAHIEQGAAQ